MTLPECDCSQIGTSVLPQQLLLRAGSTHVHRQLALNLQRHAVVHSLLEGAFLVEASPIEPLRQLLQGLSNTELADLKVAPVFEGGPNLWEATGLGLWLARLSSPWFTEATQHLIFHGQPIVDLRNQQLAGFEALVRSRHENRFYGAGPLLEAAIAHGQIRAFDARARASAIEQVFPELPEGASLFINFLPSVVYNPSVCLNTTFAACQRTGASMDRLVFEVVESEAFPDLKLLKSILDRYREEGARVALDDLGGGYTSLSYLEVMRPDIVKLDCSLIQGITPDDPREKLVGALIHYAHELGVEVVAEGIEEASELHLLQSLGADYAQGYLLGRPAEQLGNLNENTKSLLIQGQQNMFRSGF